MLNIEKIFQDKGALQSGHFLLTSGLHSDTYLQCALVLQYPQLAQELAAAMAAKLAGQKIDVVVGPAMGGVTWAYQLGLTLGCRAIFAERSEDVMTLRRGFSVAPGERVLVAEDVATTGGSTHEVVCLMKGSGAVVVGVALIVDRTAGALNIGVPYHSLYQLNPQTWSREDCPLCRANQPFDRPGSNKKVPTWEKSGNKGSGTSKEE
ncbi:MAG: orotate phosphoribosyltransferase [Bacillota bacterium]|jgi:orotate phosphoribosyltransferase|nr:orotate phosphoribosyltransferase [Bacillota bacterium]HOC06316.1 orotate phosphoribosyltransferase [Bacillota bacterium]HPZ22660.1 orotate phosphoribosyltransferase [Bacillota bacterium]HQD20274.1 orotate phosphoribosyltransferase [Bacillota bacterium]